MSNSKKPSYIRSQKSPKDSPRRRAHDVVMWRDQDEWVIYDSIADKCFRFDDEKEAIKKFQAIKQADPSARTL